MIELFTEEEYQRAKSTDFLPCKCEQCNKSFLVIKKQITFERTHKKGAYRFCSIRCKNEFNGTSQLVICDYCQKPFIKKKAEINKTKHNFCSQSCSAYFSNKHRTCGFTRSKLELYLEKVLQEKYPKIKFNFNDRETIGSELDIYIPQLKLAFELNGIVHYEPIYGEDKLKNIQTKDINKFQECQKHKISLCIIDTSSQKYFKERTSQKFLNIITEIIDENLQHLAMLNE